MRELVERCWGYNPVEDLDYGMGICHSVIAPVKESTICDAVRRRRRAAGRNPCIIAHTRLQMPVAVVAVFGEEQLSHQGVDVRQAEELSQLGLLRQIPANSHYWGQKEKKIGQSKRHLLVWRYL